MTGDDLTAVVSVVVTFSLITQYFQEGNLTEEYALPFILIAQCCFINYFISNDLSKKELVILGASFACVVFLRVNMIAEWIVFCGFLFFEKVIAKAWKKLAGYVAYFLAGAALVTVPILVYLGVNGALRSCWEDYILFNMEYTSAGKIANIMENLSTFLGGEFIILLLTVFFVVIVRSYGDRKAFQYGLLCFLYFSVSLMMAQMAGRNYGHYYLVMLPTYLYPAACLFRALLGRLRSHEDSGFLISCAILFFLFLRVLVPDVQRGVSNITATLESNAEQAEIVQYICDNTQSDEQIQVIGNQCSIYLQSGRKAASGIFYLPSADLKKAGILKKLRRDIDREAPRLLVTESGSYVSFIDRLKPDYELVKSTEKFSIYRKKG